MSIPVSLLDGMIGSSSTLQLIVIVGKGKEGREKEDGAAIAKKAVLFPGARINMSQFIFSRRNQPRQMRKELGI